MRVATANQNYHGGVWKQLERRKAASEPGFPLVQCKVDPVSGSLKAGIH